MQLSGKHCLPVAGFWYLESAKNCSNKLEMGATNSVGKFILRSLGAVELVSGLRPSWNFLLGDRLMISIHEPLIVSRSSRKEAWFVQQKWGLSRKAWARNLAHATSLPVRVSFALMLTSYRLKTGLHNLAWVDGTGKLTISPLHFSSR